MKNDKDFRDTFTGLTYEEKECEFLHIFFDELDSFHTDTIVCCDNCHDEFIEKWPGVYSQDINFQIYSVQLSLFYKNSYLHLFFTEDEYERFVKQIACPRCSSNLVENIWLYDFNFDLPDNFENILKEIDLIAKSTPFLLLSHYFAREVYELVLGLGKCIKKELLRNSLFRARRMKKNKVYSAIDFSFPPKSLVEEGRYNHAGQPVLYLAEDIDTCFYELRRPIEGIDVREIIIKRPIKMLDLYEDYLYEGLDSKKSLDIIEAIKYSSLASSPMEGQGWFKPQYVFTRFIADCAVAAKFDAIKYPSVRTENGKNVVLLTPEKLTDKLLIQEVK